MLDFILFKSNKHSEVTISQSTIADEIGCTREYVNRSIARFIEDGLLQTTYRHRNTCLYHLSEFFSDPFTRLSLSKLLPSLCYIPQALFMAISFLISISNGIDHTMRYNHDLYNNNHVTYNITGASLFNKKSRMVWRGNVIPDYIEQISVLKLTQAGKISLCGFPQEAIKHATAKFPHHRKLKDPFVYFAAIAKKYCDERNIAVQSDWVYRLNAAHGYVIGKEPNYIETKSAIAPRITSKYENKSFRLQKTVEKDSTPEHATMYKDYVPPKLQTIVYTDEEHEALIAAAKNGPGWNFLVAALGSEQAALNSIKKQVTIAR